MRDSVKESVVVLPFSGDSVLMQLRDFKQGIIFPGQWGFFGGSIDDGETPVEAALRELREEIGYAPNILHYLDKRLLGETQDVVVYSFSCELSLSVGSLTLNEGHDLGLYSLDDICSGSLFSNRMQCSYPVIGMDYISELVRFCLKRNAESLEDRSSKA